PSTCRAASTCSSIGWSATPGCAPRSSPSSTSCSTPARRSRRAPGSGSSGSAAGGGVRRRRGGGAGAAPPAPAVHFPIPRAGVVGLPAPGCLLKLMPTREGKLEMRVRGPNVTPGTWLRGGRVAPAPVDEDGFLATGDAARFEDEREPARGIVFDGRTAENFKLSSC